MTPFEYMEEEANSAKAGSRSSFPKSLTVTYGGRQVVLPEIPVLITNEGKSVRRLAPDMLSSLPARQSPTKEIPEMKLCAGCAISVALVSGDIDIAATGTVTAVDGDIVYAFGHPFLGEGVVQFAAWRTPIALTIPSIWNSFKVSAPDWRGERATINYDGNFGVYGTIGESPRAIPIEFSFEDRNGNVEELSFEVPYFQLTTIAVEFVAYLAAERYPDAADRANLVFQGRIVPRGLREVYVNEVSLARDSFVSLREDGPGSGKSPFFGVDRYLLALSDLFEENPGVDIERLQLRFAEVEARFFILERAFLEKPKVRRGGTLKVVLSIAATGDLSGDRERYTAVVPVRIPRNAEPGHYDLFVESANGFEDRGEEAERLPDTIDELIERLNNVPRSDSLYLQAVLQEEDSPRRKLARAKAVEPEIVSEDELDEEDDEDRWYKARVPPKDRLRDQTIVLGDSIKIPFSNAVVRVEHGSMNLKFEVLKAFDPTPVTPVDGEPAGFWRRLFSRDS